MIHSSEAKVEDWTIWTIKRLLQWSTAYFQEKGVTQARLETEVLLAHLLGLKRLDLYLKFDQRLSPSELNAYKDLIRRRLKSEPVAYIVGKKEFWSRDFLVTTDVLIPRPETEMLVQVVLDAVQGRQGGLLGLEIGLGSGCIAITLLAEIKDLNMVALEVSSEAIEVARKNMACHGVDRRLAIIQGDFLTYQSEEAYDFIVSNPPYVTDSEMGRLSSTVREFEPHDALCAGPDGLKFYEPIAAFAATHLRAHGFVVVEIAETQGRAVENIFVAKGLKTRLIKDHVGHDRVVHSST